MKLVLRGNPIEISKTVYNKERKKDKTRREREKKKESKALFVLLKKL